MLIFAIPVFGQKTTQGKLDIPPVRMEIVTINGEPELRVGGVPFFVHAAQFDYFRIPPILWTRSLARYRELGINTIDLRIPWNWHEPSDGQFDFDGRTNPSRDLRSLLNLIARLHFKLIVRPGPVIGDQWRNGGLPPWLLAHSNYKMSAADIQQGLAPQDAELASEDSNAAARNWLANEIHMSYARRWLTAVAHILAPYEVKNLIPVTDPDEQEGAKQTPGPLLFVALDDAEAIPRESETSDLSRYLTELRGALVRGGLDSATFANLTNAAQRGIVPLSLATTPENPSGIGFSSQWMFDPKTIPGPDTNRSAESSTYLPNSLLKPLDASSLLFLARALGEQPSLPPFISAFSTSTFASAGETRAAEPSPENLLLASRLLLAGGVRAIVYSPLQDTLTPAGWETPAAARYFRWDAPLDLAGNKGPRADGVSRNGHLISEWGAMLAASHALSDIGIVDLRYSAEKLDAPAALRYTETMQQLCRVATLAGYATDFVNPVEQPIERLLRDHVILLPVPQGAGKNIQLSEQAQQGLVEYVRQGGTLIYFPVRPQGAALGPLWQSAPLNAAAGNLIDEWPFERGRVIAYMGDFYSWVAVSKNPAENRMQPESTSAVKSFADLMEHSGVRLSLRVTTGGVPDDDLIAGEIIPNETFSKPEQHQLCADKQLCAAALISVTNLSADRTVAETFEINDPRASLRTTNAEKLSFEAVVPARESLLLPVHAPLCSAEVPGERCADEVISAGAELLGAQRDGKTLQLAFYAPARATARLHLESAPSRVDLNDTYRLEYEWKQESGELNIHIPRGSAPNYWRVIRIHLHYTPHVIDNSNEQKSGVQGLEYEVFNAIRFPLGTDATIPTSPPLVAADLNSGGHIVIASANHSEYLQSADFTVDGAFHGSGYARVFAGEGQMTRFRFQPSRTVQASETPETDGLFHGTLAIHAGRDRASGPILFLAEQKSDNSYYQHDFDGDGAPEWVLESSRLRVIVSPAANGRALALVDKSTNDNLIVFDGGLHDFLIPAGAAPMNASSKVDFSFNRAYHAEWTGEKPDVSLHLTYQENESSPAGLHVEKTVRFVGPETLEAAYRVFFIAAPSATPTDSAAKESFVSEFSVPANAAEDESTRFCWEDAPSSAPAAPHCEVFSSAGTSISLPEGVERLEILSFGKPTLVAEWTVGHAMIAPKMFSAQIRIMVPIPQPSEPPGEFTVRYTAKDGK